MSDKDFFVSVGVFVAFIAMLVFGIYSADKKQCYTKYLDFQPEYKGMITGCMVKYNGKTIPVESLRVME